jgi:hypothetical protein
MTQTANDLLGGLSKRGENRKKEIPGPISSTSKTIE